MVTLKPPVVDFNSCEVYSFIFVLRALVVFFKIYWIRIQVQAANLALSQTIRLALSQTIRLFSTIADHKVI